MSKVKQKIEGNTAITNSVVGTDWSKIAEIHVDRWKPIHMVTDSSYQYLMIGDGMEAEVRRTFLFSLSPNKISMLKETPIALTQGIFSHHGKYFIGTFGLADDEVTVWSIPECQEVAKIEIPTGTVCGLDISPDDQTLAIGTSSCTLLMCDTTNWKIIATCKKFKTPVFSVQFLSSSLVLARGEDQWIRLVNSQTGKEKVAFSLKKNRCRALVVWPDGTRCYAGLAQGSLWGWNTDESSPSFGEMILKLDNIIETPSVMTRISDSVLAIGTESGNIQLYDINTNTILNSFKAHSSFVSFLTATPDGQTLVSYATFDKTVIFWDYASRQTIGTFSAPMESFAFLDKHRALLLSKDILVLGNEPRQELEIVYPTPLNNLAVKFQLDFLAPNNPEKKRDSISIWKKSENTTAYKKAEWLLHDYSILIQELYLLDRREEAKKEVVNLLATANNYFFGTWQTTLPWEGQPGTKELWHVHLSWYRTIRSVLAWGPAAGRWKEVIDILQFFDDTCPVENDGTKEEKEYYQALRCHFNGDTSKRDQLLKQIIESRHRRNRRYPQMAETVQAIFAGDKKKTIQSWKAVAKLWLEKEGKMDWFLAPEPSFLYYLALRENIDIPLSDPWTDHIVKLP